MRTAKTLIDWRPLLGDALSPLRTGIAGKCARCGQGRLFSSFLKIAPRCEHCGLDFSFADPADGPAFFVMSITSFLAVGVMFVLQAMTPLPEWLLLSITGLVIVALSLALLVPIKGWLINAQYHYKAGEGVLAGPVSRAPCGCANCKAMAARRKRG